MAIALMALLGLLDAAYLSIERISGGALVCPVGGGCEAVQSSAYAVQLGVPVAFIGVAGYAALLLAGLYFSYLQVAVIGAICFWCVVAALLDLGIWLAALQNWRASRRAQADATH